MDDTLLVRSTSFLSWFATLPMSVILLRSRYSARASSRCCALCWTTFRASFNSRSEEHTSELQSLMRISYAVFCLKKKKKSTLHNYTSIQPSQEKEHYICRK